MRSASVGPPRCGTMKRHRSSGSATVADRPMLVRSGARRNSRARPSESRSPRLEVTSACSSSRMTRLSEPNKYGASADASSSASLLRRRQQNLRRIAALALALRARRIAGARLDADRQPHLGNRRFQIARDIDGERFERRNVKRVQPALAADAAAGGDTRRVALLLPSPLWGGVGGGGREVGRKRRRLRVTSRPPTPTLPHKGGGSRSRKRRGTRLELHSTPPGSAKIPPRSCRRRSARSAAPSARPAPWPTVPADARAASSRGWRTSG